MKRVQTAVVWGVLLVVGGFLFLLQNLGIIGQGDALIWTLLFGLGGAAFLAVYVGNRAQWWAVIPGLTLVGLALQVALSAIAPHAEWGGSLFLAAIGLSFWIIYLSNHALWWAIIPGGTLWTLAIVAGVSPRMEGMGTGAVFFAGLGLTFVLVALLPTGGARMKWAFIPALVLLGLAVFLAAQATILLQVLWPLALIGVGGFMVLRTWRSRRRE